MLCKRIALLVTLTVAVILSRIASSASASGINETFNLNDAIVILDFDNNDNKDLIELLADDEVQRNGAVIAIFTTQGDLMHVEKMRQNKPNKYHLPSYWAETDDRRSHRQGTTTQLPIQVRYVDADPLAKTSNGMVLLDKIAEILMDSKTIGVIIEMIPSPETIWTQVVYDVANSLRLPVVIANTRGPTFTPSPPIPFDGEDENRHEQQAQAGISNGSMMMDKPRNNNKRSACEIDFDPSMGYLLSAMPSQEQLDIGVLELIFGVLKTSPFVVVLIEDDDVDHGAALESTIEQLLNAATQRDQVASLFRLKGHKIGSAKWQEAVRPVSNRWRKFVVVSYRPEFERKFIHTALGLGLAGRGYMYVTLNIDFHLDPLNIPCTIGNETSVYAVRLRRPQKRSEMAGLEQEFDSLAMSTAIETFSYALSLLPANLHDSGNLTLKCAKYAELKVLRSVFDQEKQDWILELLSVTNEGFFVEMQYLFSTRLINDAGATLLNSTAGLMAGNEAASDTPEEDRWRRRTKSDISNAVDDSAVAKRSRPMPCQNNRHLRVTTIIEPPFIMRKKGGVYRAVDVVTSLTNDMSGTRPGIIGSMLLQARLSETARAHNHTGAENFEGYSIDLLQLLSYELGFSYDLSLVPDGRYGSMTENGEWNGMIGELEKGNADVALAPLTITQARSKVVSFTQSFMTVGIGMLYYKDSRLQDASDEDQLSGMFSFFRPFTWQVWLASLASLLVYSLWHRFLCLLSPLERNPATVLNKLEEVSARQAAPMNSFQIISFQSTSKKKWTAANSFWLAVSTILQQGCDFFPTAKSTRFLYITWGFVSLVLCSCYTANLAAFLTTERLEMQLRKPTDLLSQNKTRYGTLIGGSTQSFFKNSKIDIFRELYANMDRDRSLVEAQADGVRRVLREKGRYAFFLESTKLEYEVARDCRLVQIGALLDSKGYGIATQRGSPLRDSLSTIILKLQTEGVLQSLKNKWWVEQRVVNDNINCPDSSSDKSSAAGGRRSANRLSIDVLGGAFIVLIGGLFLGLFVCLAEIGYYGMVNAVRQNGRFVSSESLLAIWRFHVRRVLSAGASKIVLQIGAEKSTTIKK